MKLTEGIAELVGTLIGDGYVYTNNRKYQIGFVGNPITDEAYFAEIQRLILAEWNKESKLTFRERGVRLVINSKEICSFLIDELHIAHGEGKCEKVVIPDKIAENWNLARRTIRGIADTDGSVFVANKSGSKRYPSIEITTSSPNLAEQVKSILISQGFRVAKIWNYKSKLSRRTTYKIPLNGRTNLKLWIEKIGFSNPYKLERAQSYLNNKA